MIYLIQFVLWYFSVGLGFALGRRQEDMKSEIGSYSYLLFFFEWLFWIIFLIGN